MAVSKGRCQETHSGKRKGGRRPLSPSGKKKAQMFMVTMIFLIGLVFTVQQMLFQYTELDLSTPLRQNSIYLLKNAKNLVNSTIRSTADCDEFALRVEELKNFLESRAPSMGYVLSLSYKLNCTFWSNSPPDSSPLNATLNIFGKDSETTSTLYLYHN